MYVAQHITPPDSLPGCSPFSYSPLATNSGCPFFSRPPSTGCQPSTPARSPCRYVIHLTSFGSAGPHKTSYAVGACSEPAYEMEHARTRCRPALWNISPRHLRG